MIMIKLIRYSIVILVVFAIGIAVYLWSRPKETTTTTKTIKETHAKVYQKKDDNGNNHSGYDVTAPVSAKDARDPSVPLGIVDSSAAALKIARTQIMYVTQVASITKDSLLQAKFIIDKLQKRIARYQDQYVDLTYTPDSDSEKPGIFSFSYNNKVTVTQYSLRNKVLGLPIGAKKTYIDVTSNDPRTLINGLKSLSLEQKQPEFGLRFQARTAFSPRTGRIGYGPAARIDIGRLSFQGNYMYYPVTGNWRPSINATYDVIRF